MCCCDMQGSRWIMDEIRGEVRKILSRYFPEQTPAVKRTRVNGWLAAAAVPRDADAGMLEACREELERNGYRTDVLNSWLLLDRLLPDFPDTGCVCGGSPGQLISVLRVHARRPEPEITRHLVLAADSSREQFCQACASLMEECAVRLRKREKLPDVLGAVCAAVSRYVMNSREGEERA